jgi:hypothetical protein
MCWLPTGCALTARQRPKSACRLGTSKDCGGTIGPRIRINRLDDASGRCSVSNRPDQPSASCPFTPSSKTRSTSNAISHPAARSASFETKRSGRGEPPPLPQPELRLPIFTRPNLVRVTAPSRLLFLGGVLRLHALRQLNRVNPDRRVEPHQGSSPLLDLDHKRAARRRRRSLAA